MTKLMQKRLKTSLTVSAVLVAAFLAGCASKIDTVSYTHLTLPTTPYV